MTPEHELEYNTAVEQYQHCTTLRRQDLAFVTTAQGAALTIIGKELLHLGGGELLLSVVAFLLLLLGVNSERRLAAYMAGYTRRAQELETQYGMTVLHYGWEEVGKRGGLVSNRVIFPAYYLLFAATWMAIWCINAAG